ncbi:hypothetical protein KSP40_PGU002574 [Platanthera guangdongensis]|uniref:Uncharacterized protein n=1 Tax=Platanthera guangdongensis TaxID=2320717 RepID=A0ABR2MWI1_9ASPA
MVSSDSDFRIRSAKNWKERIIIPTLLAGPTLSLASSHPSLSFQFQLPCFGFLSADTSITMVIFLLQEHSVEQRDLSPRTGGLLAWLTFLQLMPQIWPLLLYAIVSLVTSLLRRFPVSATLLVPPLDVSASNVRNVWKLRAESRKKLNFWQAA